MAEEKMMRLSQVARKLNVGTSTILDVLGQRGFKVENSPNAKITAEQFDILAKEFRESALERQEASELTIGKKHNENMIIDAPHMERQNKVEEEDLFVPKYVPEKEFIPKTEEATQEKETPLAETQTPESGRITLQPLKILGKIELDKKGNPVPPKVQPPVVETPILVPEVPKEEAPIPVEELKKEEPKKEEPKVEEPKVEEPKKEEPIIQPVVVQIETPIVKPVDVTPKVQREEPSKVMATEKKDLPPVQKTQEKVPEATLPEKILPEKVEIVKARGETLKGLSVVGRIELPVEKDKRKKGAPVTSSAEEEKKKKKRKRKRLRPGQTEETPAAAAAAAAAKAKATPTTAATTTPASTANAANARPKPGKKGKVRREEVSEKDVQDKLRATLATMGGRNVRGKTKSKTRDNRENTEDSSEVANEIKLTEFISVNDLASLMDVPVNDVISVCLNLGMFVSINQRLDAEAIRIIADEFNYTVKFISAEEELDSVLEESIADDPNFLKSRAPIVTIMGHVDHGKTSLLDYIRKAKVAAGEAGGITQHIGAYDVMTSSGKRITFLDTPGHEAFTAMRARGAKITDVAIIVVAADDSVMPQTKEAINHAQLAGVPIVIAMNKIDKPNANPEKIRQELAQENVLVEEWGGKYQSQEISAKTGIGIDDLLEKVLLEAEMLDLKANPDRKATGTVIEAALDKGRGYVATMMVQTGTLCVGDIVLAGAHYGRIRAMLDHRGVRLKKAGPSTPVQVLGLGGAPQAGEKFSVMESDRDAREIANKREQILREQSIRTRRHITLDEIGRRLAIGSFKELNIIVKGDVDGSVEALADSLLRLSTGEVQVRIIHKGVGQISESDVLLASASDAVIVGFQVRPSVNARRLAENEEIEIRLYSIIYDAIDEVRAAMEGMLAPKVEEVIAGVIEVRDIFRISKIGTVAGCFVLEGLIKRSNKIRVVRDGIVLHTGEIDALKRFKDDVNEVRSGYECGLSVRNFNDINEGDLIESFEFKEVKRTL